MVKTIAETGMSTENVKTKCPAKPITYAFIYFNANDERNRYVRSANMVRKKLRGRKINISQSMDAEERFHQKGWDTSHPHETWHFPRIDLAEQTVRARVISRWTDSGKNMPERLPQVQVSRHRIRSRRIHGKMAGKKLVATSVSSREVGSKRREEGKTVSSRECTETHKDQRDDKGTGSGGGKQKAQTRWRRLSMVHDTKKRRRWNKNERKWKLKR